MAHEDWYLQYGLERDPFTDGGMQGLFYPGAGRQETVEQLQHLARFGDCVLLVTGPAGAGKSATLAQFVAQCPADVRCAVVDVALLEGPEQVLRRVLAGFGLPADGSGSLAQDLLRLERFCEQCRAEGLLGWLVFDDAQHLHPDALSLLGPLLARTGGRLRLVFFAEPAWQEALRAAIGTAAPVHAIALAALDPDETQAYIHYRMKTAGFELDPPLNAADLQRIHDQAGGLPGRIDVHARQTLIDVLRTVEQPLTALPLWHLGVVGATLLALALLWAFDAFDDSADAPRPGPAPVADGRAAPEPVILAQEPEVPASAAVAPNEAPLADTAPQDGGQSSSAAETATAPLDGDDAAAEEESSPEEEAPEEAVPEDSPPPNAAAAPAAGTEPAGTGAPAAEVPPAPPVVESPPSKEEPASPPEAEPAPPDTPVSSAKPGASLSADEEYLLGLDGSLFVLQIMSSADASRVRRFAASQSLPLRQYRKLNDGRIWYALVHGEFRDRTAADQVARDISARMPGTQPWLRRLDAVQDEIRQARAH
jgi:type II secretory pathway predicted ATPase ExeA/septal ring-binding cell division protein DamX